MADRSVFVNHRGFMPANTREDWQAIEDALETAWRISGLYGYALVRQVALEIRSLRGTSR